MFEVPRDIPSLVLPSPSSSLNHTSLSLTLSLHAVSHVLHSFLPYFERNNQHPHLVSTMTLYNRKEGANEGVQEFPDQVTMVQLTGV